MNLPAFRSGRLFLLLVLLLAPGVTRAQDQLEIDWQTSATDYRGQFRQSFVVYCPPAGAATGTIWGSGIYTDDSPICAAAVHALATFDLARGGTVYFAMEPGQEVYDAERRRGITTARYDSWGGSFRIVAGIPGKRLREVTNMTPIEITWSTTAKHLKGSIASRRVVLCPRNGEQQVVWGSHVYNDDSSICSAAVHAGLIKRATGGGIALQGAPAREDYVGVTRNAVTSLPWERGQGSFRFAAGQTVVALPAPAPEVATLQPERVAPPRVPLPVALVLQPVRAPTGEWLIDWRTTATQWRGQVAALVSVYCPAGGTVATVWGSGPYTDDSSVCSAAVHALATFNFAAGGTVRIALTRGEDAYPATVRHGVASSEWGAWENSFRIVTGVPGKHLNEIADTTTTEVSWSATAEHLRGKAGPQRVVCPREGQSAAVFGSGVYSDNSSICNAAVHAGLVTRALGGIVSLRMENGRASYSGSMKNETTTQGFGEWKGSFSFSK